MKGMFFDASSFNGDISKWDVSRVTRMDEMFYNASAFTQNLCTGAWINSKASKSLMFEGSPGSISPMACTITTIPAAVFSPQSGAELSNGVGKYLEYSAKGDGQMHGSEATSPAAGNDHGTFVCKPEVRLDKLKLCKSIG